MKERIFEDYYIVCGPDQSWKLGEQFDSITEAVKGGEEMNRREVERGYKPSKWIVVRVMFERLFNDKGEFQTETTTKIAISLD